MTGSLRFRITVLAMVVLALVFGVAGFIVVRIVETELIDSAERGLAQTAEQLADEQGVLRVPEDALFRLDGEEGELYLALEQGEGEVFGELIDPETSESVGELVVDPGTGEITEVFDPDGEPLRAPLPESLEDVVLESVRVGEDERTLVVARSIADVRATLDTVRRALLIVIPVIVLLAGALVWFLVGRVLAPVGGITRRAETISASNVGERVPVPRGSNEISDLARVVNRMLERIELGVKRQRQFGADASHELRTPLATIRGAAEVIEPSLEADQAGAGQALIREVDRVDALVDDLLALATLDEPAAGELVLVDLATVAREVSEELCQDGVKLELELPDSSPEVLAGRRSLGRAISNLVGNAVRHAHSKVTITVSRSGASQRLTVTDDGPGIPEADRDRVFERFVRLDAARTRTGGGAGLGLSIARGIIERYGGTLVIEDPPATGGTTLAAQLPAADGR